MSEFALIVIEIVIVILFIGMYGYSIVEKVEDVAEK
jgi:hypothetical protein